MERTPRTQRKQRNVILQKRDHQILFLVGRFGLATTVHLARLYFSDNSDTANKRLRSLFNAGYLCRHLPFGNNHQLIYTLTQKGKNLLASRFKDVTGLQRIPKTLDVADLEHRLVIVDIRVSLVLLSRQEKSFRLLRFLSGKELLSQVRNAEVGFVPDAIIITEYQGKQYLAALEVDQGTEPMSVWLEKSRMYGHAFVLDTPLMGIKNWQVLVVAPSTERLRSIKTKLDKLGQPDRLHYQNTSSLTLENILPPRRWN